MSNEICHKTSVAAYAKQNHQSPAAVQAQYGIRKGEYIQDCRPMTAIPGGYVPPQKKPTHTAGSPKHHVGSGIHHKRASHHMQHAVPQGTQPQRHQAPGAHQAQSAHRQPTQHPQNASAKRAGAKR